MRRRERRRHEAHMRVLNVCVEHSALFDANPGGQKARPALATSVADVDRLFALQQQAKVDQTAAAAEIRRTRRQLRADAKAIVTIGKAMPLDPAEMRTMELPWSANDDELLAYSRALYQRTWPHADVFAAEGLPAEALPQFANTITAFAGARDAQAGARQRFSAAYESIRDALDAADRTVSVLIAIAAKTPAAIPEVVAKLRIASRVGPRVSAPEPTTPQATSTDKAA